MDEFPRNYYLTEKVIEETIRGGPIVPYTIARRVSGLLQHQLRWMKTRQRP